MSRPVMPFIHVLETERGRWKKFRIGLSKKNQEAFDRLFDRAKFHTAAVVYMAHPWPRPGQGTRSRTGCCLNPRKFPGRF